MFSPFPRSQLSLESLAHPPSLTPPSLNPPSLHSPARFTRTRSSGYTLNARSSRSSAQRELVSQIDWNKKKEIFKWNNAVYEGPRSSQSTRCHGLGEGEYQGQDRARNDIPQAQKEWKEQDQSICQFEACGKDVEIQMGVWRYTNDQYKDDRHPDKFRMWMPTKNQNEWSGLAYCLNRPGHSGWGAGFKPQGISVFVKRTQKYKNRFLKKCRNQDWGRCSKQCGSGQSIK